MEQYISKDALVAEIERYKHKADERLKIKGRTLAEDCKDSALQNLCGNLLHFIDTLEVKEVDLEKVPIILTEEILKINGFKLYAPPRYKEAFWSKIYEDKEENEYVFYIYMKQRVEHLLTVTPLATSDGKGHPDCHLPHPKTVQQLQNSLRLFGIEDIIRV